MAQGIALGALLGSVVVEYMDRAQRPTVNFSTQNLHLTQSEPGKIDPMADYTVKATRVAQNLFLFSRTSH